MHPYLHITVEFLSSQDSDNVVSTRSYFLIGNGKCKQLSDRSELELSDRQTVRATVRGPSGPKKVIFIIYPFKWKKPFHCTSDVFLPDETDDGGLGVTI